MLHDKMPRQHKTTHTERRARLIIMAIIPVYIFMTTTHLCCARVWSYYSIIARTHTKRFTNKPTQKHNLHERACLRMRARTYATGRALIIYAPMRWRSVASNPEISQIRVREHTHTHTQIDDDAVDAARLRARGGRWGGARNINWPSRPTTTNTATAMRRTSHTCTHAYPKSYVFIDSERKSE